MYKSRLGDWLSFLLGWILFSGIFLHGNASGETQESLAVYHVTEGCPTKAEFLEGLKKKWGVSVMEPTLFVVDLLGERLVLRVENKRQSREVIGSDCKELIETAWLLLAMSQERISEKNTERVAQKRKPKRVGLGVGTLLGIGLTPQTSAAVAVQALLQFRTFGVQSQFAFFPDQRYQNQGGAGGSLQASNVEIEACKGVKVASSKVGACIGGFFTTLKGEGYRQVLSLSERATLWGPQLKIQAIKRWPRGLYLTAHGTGRVSLTNPTFEVIEQSSVQFSPSKLSYLLGFDFGMTIF